MHHPSDFETWRRRHDELMRDLEDERLARLSRQTHEAGAHRTRSTPLGRARGRVRALLRIAPSEKL